MISNVELLHGLDHGNTNEIIQGLDHDADLELINLNGFTALLHMCSVGEHDIIVHIIVEYEGNYLHQEKDGWDCLAFASYRGDVDTLKYLLTLPDINSDSGNRIEFARERAQSQHQFQVVKILDSFIVQYYERLQHELESRL